MTHKQILNICKMYEVFADHDIEFIYLAQSIIMENERSKKSREVGVEPARDLEAEFKNFHRALCERFEYVHDEKDWKRDQVSLIEWIAKRVAALTAAQSARASEGKDGRA